MCEDTSPKARNAECLLKLCKYLVSFENLRCLGFRDVLLMFIVQYICEVAGSVHYLR